jgi:alpha-N-arabinofuranosidase
MYKPFRGATSLPVAIDAPKRKVADVEVPTVTASAARDKDGRLHVALTNLDPRESANVTIKVEGASPKKLGGRVLTSAALDAHNTFAKPATIEPAAFDGARVSGGTIKVTLPAKSVVVLSETGR